MQGAGAAVEAAAKGLEFRLRPAFRRPRWRGVKTRLSRSETRATVRYVPHALVDFARLVFWSLVSYGPLALSFVSASKGPTTCWKVPLQMPRLGPWSARALRFGSRQ